MQLDSYYQFFQSALSPETCQKIIDTGLAEIKKSKESGLSTTGWTYGNMEKGSFGSKPFEGKSAGELLSEGQKLEEYYIRDSEIVWLNDEWIYNEIVPLVKSANNSAGWNWEISGKLKICNLPYIILQEDFTVGIEMEDVITLMLTNIM